jgi:hypothetical protein
VATREDQFQPFVGNRRLVHLLLRCDRLQQAGLLGEFPLAPDTVDRAVARGGDEPGAGVARRAIARPALGRDRKGLLGGLLGEVEIAEKADQAGEYAAPFVAEDLLEDR